MLISKITVNGVHANTTKLGTMTCGMVGAKVQFTFGRGWEGLNKTAVFRCMDITKDVLNIDSEVTIPHEVLVRSGSPLYAGVYGTNADGTEVIPTVWATVGIVYSGANPSGDPSTERSPEVWEQLQAQIDELREQGVDDATIAAAVEKWLEENPIEGAEVPETLPNPHKLTFTGAVTAEYDGSKEVTVEIPEGGGIEVTGAEVGQTIVVKAVDENGKPTEWECADFPSGGSGDSGGGATETLVASYTHSGNLEVVVSSIDYDTGTITAVGHGLSENDMIYATQNWECTSGINPETYLPSGMKYGTKYFVVNVTTDTFQISTTKGGECAVLNAKTSADFSKWHFERDVATYGSSIFISNLGGISDFAVRILGKSLTSSCGFYPENVRKEIAYAQYAADGFSAGNALIGVIAGGSSDILLDVKTTVKYNENTRRYTLHREGVSVRNKSGSTWGVTTTDLHNHGVSIQRNKESITELKFWNCFPANGTIVEVYKL